MAKVKITLNDGSTKIVQLDDNFTDADIEEVTNTLNSSLDLQGQGTEAEPFQVGVSKNIDLRPSGLATTAAKYAVGVPTSAVESLVTRKPFGEVLNKNLELFKQVDELPAVKRGDTVLDIGTAFMLPEVKAVQGIKGANAINRALTGAYQGGLINGAESLANEGDLSGVVPGAVGGAVLNTGLPLVGKGLEKTTKLLPMAGGWVGRTFGRIQPETLQRAVQADSKALDISPNQAQNLLSNVTERVRTGYDNLLKKRGEAISKAEENLRQLTDRIDVNNLADDITNVFNKGQGERINTTRDLTGNLEDDLLELVYKGADENGTISPIDLQRIKQEVGQMTNWADTTRPKIQNTTLEQIYGDFNNRLMNLSPELAAANKSYAQLKNFQNNEGLKRILRPGDNIDSASTALKNYNNTVTKGNTNRNIQDLENVLVADGQKPFLNEIDDINAAMDLNNIRGTGDSFYANLGTALARPVLKGVRKLNQSGLPQAYERLKRVLPQNFVPVAYGIKELIDRD